MSWLVVKFTVSVVTNSTFVFTNIFILLSYHISHISGVSLSFVVTLANIFKYRFPKCDSLAVF